MRPTLLALFSLSLAAQTFQSGSNGSDGALNLGANTPGVVNGVLVFDPVALNLDQDGDNIYHFTSITIRDFIRVRFYADKMRNPGPLVFLSSGPVNIQGVLNLDGDPGHPSDSNIAIRRPSRPGPGGYPGGIGGKANGGSPSPGLGPGGGRVGANATVTGGNGCPAAHVTNALPSWCSSLPNNSYGNSRLLPLIGGSGGSGGWGNSINFGEGGGAGGGAIRIVSATHIAFGTGVNSSGGANGCNGFAHIGVSGGSAAASTAGVASGGAGSGGSVHLVAPLISGCGQVGVYVSAGTQRSFNGSPGRIRFDATNIVGVSTSGQNPTTGPLQNVPLPTPTNLRIISVNGVAAPAFPQGGFLVPDLSLNTTATVPIVVQATNIPVNSPITIQLTTEEGADILTTPVNLTGSLSSSTATINVDLPPGVTRLFARATW